MEKGKEGERVGERVGEGGGGRGRDCQGERKEKGGSRRAEGEWDDEGEVKEEG